MKNISLLSLLFLFFACSSPSAQEEPATAKKTVAPIQQKAPTAPAAKQTIQTKQLTPAKAGTGKINWMTLEEAQAANQKNPKKIFMDMYTSWCGPCKNVRSQYFFK